MSNYESKYAAVNWLFIQLGNLLAGLSYLDLKISVKLNILMNQKELPPKDKFKIQNFIIR